MKTDNLKKFRGILCTVIGGLLWGFSGTCLQFVKQNYAVDALWMTSFRMLTAGILLMALCAVTKREQFKRLWATPKDLLSVFVFGVVGILFCQYTYLVAISASNAGTATVLQYTSPVMIMLITCVAMRKFPNLKEIFSIILVLLGTFLLATHGHADSLVISKAGLAWGLISAVAMTVYTMEPVSILKKYNSLLVTAGGMLFGGIFITLLGRTWQSYVAVDAAGWLGIMGVVIPGTLIAYTLYMQGVSDIGAVKTSMLACIEPVAAAVFSALWLGTGFVWIDAVGFACIITTVFLVAGKDTAKSNS